MQNLRRRINPAVYSTLAKLALTLTVSLGCAACTTTNSQGSYERLYMMQSFAQGMQGYDTLYTAPRLPMRQVIQQQPVQQPTLQPYYGGQ